MRTNVLCCASMLIACSVICRCSSAGVGPATQPGVGAQQPATQPVVVPTVLHFNEKSIKAILAGTKTASIRKGIRSISDGAVKAVGTAGSTVMLKVVDATQKKLGDLTVDDAKANGSASLEDLQTEMAKNYPGIKTDDIVTVITFRLN